MPERDSWDAGRPPVNDLPARYAPGENDSAERVRVTRAGLRVVVIHNRYRVEGGEEVVVGQETRMLQDAGIEVRMLERDSKCISDLSGPGRVSLGVRAVWHSDAARELREIVRDWRPNIVHVHNTQPLISAAVHHVAARAGIPSIQSIHNYRLFCLNGLALRRGHPCTSCLGRFPLRGVLERCYQASFLSSAAAAASNITHAALGTWGRVVRRFSVPSLFAAGLLARTGVPADRIVYRPQALADDPGVGKHDGNYILFAGRLSEEKGLGLLRQRRFIDALPLPLHVCGDGPGVESIQDLARSSGRMVYHGRVQRARLLELMRSATVLIVPSRFFEVAPVVLIEALAVGLPAIVSNRGAMPEHLGPGSGWRVDDDSGESWLATLSEALSDAVRLRSASAAARETYLARHTPAAALDNLLGMYESTIAAGRN